MIICNPGNPSTRVWSKDELNRLIKLTKENNVVLLIDECYSDIVWKPHLFYSPIQDQLHDHVVVVRGFSKVLGIQSWRCGYLVSTTETTQTLMRISDPIYICLPFVQHAVGKYLNEHFDDFKIHKQMVGELMQRNWKILSVTLKETLGWEPIEPAGSMYGMFLHSSDTDMLAVKKGLEKGVGVCPGSMFYENIEGKSNKYVRIHCGVSEEKTKLIIENLKK